MLKLHANSLPYFVNPDKIYLLTSVANKDITFNCAVSLGYLPDGQPIVQGADESVEQVLEMLVNLEFKYA